MHRCSSGLAYLADLAARMVETFLADLDDFSGRFGSQETVFLLCQDGGETGGGHHGFPRQGRLHGEAQSVI